MAKAYLYPTSYTNVSGSPWLPYLSGVPGGTITGNVDDPVNCHDGNATTAFEQSGLGASSHRLGLSTMLPANVINYIKLHFICKEQFPTTSTWQPYVWVNATLYTEGTAFTPTGSYVDYVTTVTLNPYTGVKWTEADLNALEVGLYYDDTSFSAWFTSVFVEVDYVPAPIGLEPAREAASRRQWFRKHPPDIIKANVPLLLAMQADPMTLLPMSHLAGPEEAGEGWGIEKWKRRPTLVLARTLHPDHGELTLMDLRRHLCLYRDDAWPTVRCGIDAAGIARFANASVTRAYTRTGNAWIPNPAGGKVLQVTENLELHAEGGDLFEGIGYNYARYSSFDQGAGAVFTGWTAAGSGTVTEETSELLWESEFIARCPLLTASTPIAADFTFTGTASSSVAANTVGMLSVDRYDLAAAAPLYYKVIRGVDGAYWRDSDQTWQVASTWNAMGATPGAWARHKSKIMDVGANATTLTVIVGVPTTGVAGQANRVGHVQWGPVRWASSRIVTVNATGTRGASQLLVSNDTGARVWNAARGAFVCEVVTEWNSADLNAAAAFKEVVTVYHDADNYDRVYYNPATGAWVFRARHAGTTVNSTLTAAVTAGTPVRIGARWIGADGELGYSPYQIHVFVDGVRGSTESPGAPLTEAAACDMEIGSYNGANSAAFQGQVRLIRTFAHVPTDIEMARLP